MRVLYLSYTGLLEPLGQSQVFAYLKLLSRDHQITVVTFEKAADLADAGAMADQRRACASANIRWIPKRYHHRPRLLATLWDLFIFSLTAIGEAGRTDVIHARAYIASFVALLAGWVRRKPFIFDMRAFWPEEMIAAGALRRGSVVHRLIRWGERACLTRAAAVVSLTEAGVVYMRMQMGPKIASQRFAVVPTCVDLDRFQLTPRTEHKALVIGSAGTVLSGWFRFPWLIAFFRAMHAAAPESSFRILSRDNPDDIRAAATRDGADFDIAVYAAAPAQMPQAVATFDAVAMFFETGIAKLGSCPTRMGEVLAVGRPVIANPGVGDVAEIVREHRVGVLVDSADDTAMAAAANALLELLKDPDLPARCRAAAEACFSLARGAATYDRLYRDISS